MNDLRFATLKFIREDSDVLKLEDIGVNDHGSQALSKQDVLSFLQTPEQHYQSKNNYSYGTHCYMLVEAVNDNNVRDVVDAIRECSSQMVIKYIKDGCSQNNRYIYVYNDRIISTFLEDSPNIIGKYKILWNNNAYCSFRGD